MGTYAEFPNTLLKHIHDLQQGIREQNKTLNYQLEHIRAQIAGAP